MLICSTCNTLTVCTLGCNTATEKAMQDIITAVIKPRKHFTTAECLYPKGFAEIPVQELLLSEIQYTYTQPGAIRWTCWKRLKQLNHTQDSREKEFKSIISEGNSNGNLGRLNATWYLTRSNISHYIILWINIPCLFHIHQNSHFSVCYGIYWSHLNGLEEKETLSTLKVGKKLLGTKKTPHKFL